MQTLWLLSLSGSGQPEPFLQTEFGEIDGRFSPDGNWVAYTSDESGRFEVVVEPFPGGGSRKQISTSGGRQPLWRRDGKELFYIDSNEYLVAVPVTTNGTALEIGNPRILFQAELRTPWASNYAVTSDGQRFLLNTYRGESEVSPTIVVLNWAELER